MKIKIGTRRSKLAMAQTNLVVEELHKKFSDIETEVIPIVTEGDVVLDKPLTQIGGKGIFVAEIEYAVLNKMIDIAVHSAKDLPVSLESGAEISGVLKRGDYRDALVTLPNTEINNTSFFTVGTSSVRRAQNMKNLYPNVKVKDIRGNVDTRLKKLKNGEYDAIILAAAGLKRLGVYESDEYNVTAFDYNDFLPSPCQGIIAIESRKNDFVTPIVKEINDIDTFHSFETEQSVLRLLNTNCSMPVGAYSKAADGIIELTVSNSSDRKISGTAEIVNRFRLAEELISKL
ncbi:MAG: hydroxymethylbilane synthase [Clostridiales bacterium]|nr:hydroxymethylbilane synthase [Clostridiales bacterium]